MDEDKQRINIEDLPRAEEELTSEEAKDVQGGYSGQTYINQGVLNVGSTSGNTVGGSIGSTTGNTIGGSLADDISNPIKR